MSQKVLSAQQRVAEAFRAIRAEGIQLTLATNEANRTRAIVQGAVVSRDVAQELADLWHQDYDAAQRMIVDMECGWHVAVVAEVHTILITPAEEAELAKETDPLFWANALEGILASRHGVTGSYPVLPRSVTRIPKLGACFALAKDDNFAVMMRCSEHGSASVQMLYK